MLNLTTNNLMKKIYFFLFFVSIFAFNTKAQVTIGSTNAPVPGAILELRSDTLGFLLPRVELVNPESPAPLPAHVKGMFVYNTKTDSANLLIPGIYYNTGKEWLSIPGGTFFTRDNWFYLPSIVLTAIIGTGYQVDLYAAYMRQFDVNNQDMKIIGSPGAPSLLLKNPLPTDFYYYVLDYDNEVFSNISINENGIMNYDIIGSATDATFINIILVEKHK